MAGRMLQQARKDALKINKAIGWEEDIKLSTPDNTLTINLKGIHTKHHISFDDVGQRINAKNAHILISEKDLNELLYPYRNSTGNIALIGHKVEVADFNGDIKKFIINETYPSETFGLIVCILGDTDKKQGTHGGFNRGTNRFR